MEDIGMLSSSDDVSSSESEAMTEIAFSRVASEVAIPSHLALSCWREAVREEIDLPLAGWFERNGFSELELSGTSLNKVGILGEY